MKVFKIKKKNGGERLIFSPSYKQKHYLRVLAYCVDEQNNGEGIPYAHGFARNRSAVTNAKQHIGFRYSLCVDLKDCFDNLKPEKFNFVSSKYATLNVGKGLGIIKKYGIRQGFPCSPALCNAILRRMDEDIALGLEHVKHEVCYTRYADDITVSCNDRETLEAVVLTKIHTYTKKYGQELNDKKTRILDSRAGRRIITGVAVDDDGLHPTRKVKRKLRAARHQAAFGYKGAQNSARGLEEWCKLKEPSGERRVSKVDKAASGELIRRLLK